MPKFNTYPLASGISAEDTLLIWQDSTGLVKQVRWEDLESAQEVVSVAALKALDVALVSDHDQVFVGGYYDDNDGGGGVFIFDAASAAVDNGGTVIAPTAGSGRWIRALVNGAITPEGFGMRGNGTSDDFPQWENLVAFVNAAGGGVVEMTQGKVYFLDYYITSGDGNESPAFFECDGLSILGNGATIKVKGGFNRAVVTTFTLSGLTIKACQNVRVENITLDGNSNTITKNVGVGEAAVFGLWCGACVNVHIENVISKYWITDGLGFNTSNDAAPHIANKNIKCVNVISTYNARQGLTIALLRGGVFENCEFTYTGRSSYGAHSPSAGVDIEPDYYTGTPGNQTDVNTGDLVFNNCRSNNNAGPTFSAGLNVKSDSIRISDSVFDTGAAFNQNIGFGLAVPYSVVENTYIALGASSISTSPSEVGFSSTTFNNCVITGGSSVAGGPGLIVSTSDETIKIINCRIVSTMSTSTSQAIITLTGRNVHFDGNYVYVPKEVYNGTFNYQAACSFGSYAITVNNLFETNLLITAHASNTAHFTAGGVAANMQFFNRFKGTNPGMADSFRPAANWAYNTTYPFSDGPFPVGNGVVFRDYNAEALLHTYSNAAPVAGDHTRGEIVYNNFPTAGGTLGWVCVTAGTPGTWKTFGAITP